MGWDLIRSAISDDVAAHGIAPDDFTCSRLSGHQVGKSLAGGVDLIVVGAVREGEQLAHIFSEPGRFARKANLASLEPGRLGQKPRFLVTFGPSKKGSHFPRVMQILGRLHHGDPEPFGCQNYLFAGSPRGAEWAASLCSLIETAKLNGLDPETYLRDVLTRIADHPAKRLADLLPWNWAVTRPAALAA